MANDAPFPLLLPLNFIPSTSRAAPPSGRRKSFHKKLRTMKELPDPLCQATSSLGAQKSLPQTYFAHSDYKSAIAIRLLPLCLAEAFPGMMQNLNEWNESALLMFLPPFLPRARTRLAHLSCATRNTNHEFLMRTATFPSPSVLSRPRRPWRRGEVRILDLHHPIPAVQKQS